MTSKPAPLTFGLILAGGRSQRFGSEKAMAILDGRPLIRIALDALAPHCQRIAVSAHPGSGAEAFARTHGLTVLPDSPAHARGPLAGVAAGLTWAHAGDAQRLLVSPCDAPAVTASDLAPLIAGEAGSPRFILTPSGPQPLFCALPAALRGALAETLADGHHPSVQAWLKTIGATPITAARDAPFQNLNTPTPRPQDLVRERFSALYRCDARGALVESNEWDPRPAPLLHLTLFQGGSLAHVGAPAPDALSARFEAIRGLETHRAWPVREPERRSAYVEAARSFGFAGRTSGGPVYLCGSLAPSAQGTLVDITGENAAVLRAHFPDWVADAGRRAPFVALVLDGDAVSLCASSRMSPRLHCAGVETAAGFRGCGFARAAVAAWARRVQALGATPIYSTDWGNLASQAVARGLSSALFAVDFRIT